MTSADLPHRPVVPLDIRASGAGAPAARHRTVLAPDGEPLRTALEAAMGEPDASTRRAAVSAVVGAHPAFIEGWARLSEIALGAGDAVCAYADARVAYHRGLDRLRRDGWGGTGLVQWREAGNRGFLRGLHALLAAAAALGEADEAERCRNFLLELDPDDALGIAVYPKVPGPDWAPPPLPDE